MRSKKYEFQAYPNVWMYWGAMSDAEYVGCRPTIAKDTVWFAPQEKVPPSELIIKPDPDSLFLPRDIAIRKAIEERFGGGYVIDKGAGYYGSALDIVAMFYGPEDLSYMFFDEPEEVIRLCQETVQAVKEIGQKILDLNPNSVGAGNWSGLFAPIPWMGAQCDCCAMFGPNIFDEFVLPDLKECFKSSPRYNLYHLDGPGEIIHMDKILAIPELRCMQWQPLPGGEVSLDLEIYERIHKADKNMWVTGPIEKVVLIAKHLGTTQGLYR